MTTPKPPYVSTPAREAASLANHHEVIRSGRAAFKKAAALRRKEKRAPAAMYATFLDLLREGWSVRRAIVKAGFPHPFDIYARRKEDADFKATMDAAKAEGADW